MRPTLRDMMILNVVLALNVTAIFVSTVFFPVAYLLNVAIAARQKRPVVDLFMLACCCALLVVAVLSATRPSYDRNSEEFVQATILAFSPLSLALSLRMAEAKGANLYLALVYGLIPIPGFVLLYMLVGIGLLPIAWLRDLLRLPLPRALILGGLLWTPWFLFLLVRPKTRPLRGGTHDSRDLAERPL